MKAMVFTAVLASCSSPAAPDAAPSSTLDPSVPVELLFPAMDPAGPYVSTLCNLDLTGALDAVDPVEAIIALLGAVPAQTDVQQQELARISEGLRAGARSDDPGASRELYEALALLRGRCAS